jgi:hypothetical protein
MEGMILMNDDTHVYCTDCTNFRLCDEEIPYCVFEDKCDINDCEDSKAFIYRPYFNANM